MQLFLTPWAPTTTSHDTALCHGRFFYPRHVHETRAKKFPTIGKVLSTTSSIFTNILARCDAIRKQTINNSVKNLKIFNSWCQAYSRVAAPWQGLQQGLRQCGRASNFWVNYCICLQPAPPYMHRRLVCRRRGLKISSVHTTETSSNNVINSYINEMSCQ